MANYKETKQYSLLYTWVLLVLAMLVSIKPTVSQNINARFIKQSIKNDAGSIIFNVVKIYNQESKTVKVKPVLLLPDGWAVFSTSMYDTVINPFDSISLAFRIRIPQNASSESSHKINFQIFSDQNKLILQNSFLVQTNPFHDWDVIVPKKRIYFFPGKDEVIFEMKITNKGNTLETISLDIRPDKKIRLTTLNELDVPSSIIIRPGMDTTIKMKAKYSYSEERIFDLSKIQIYASSNTNKIYRAVILEKYSDNYKPFEIDRTLPQQAEIGFRTFNNNTEILPFIKTNGIAIFDNDDSFKYNFTYYDLTQTENLIANSYYNFLYSHNELKVGLGAFSSMLGRNLYSRNSLMVAHKIKLNKTGALEGFASYGFVEPKLSAAIGYIYEKDKILMNTSVSYDIDEFKKINTASFLYHSNMISVAKGHDVSAVIYAYNESHYLKNKYSLGGIAWDISYFGRLSRKITLQVTTNYGSPNIPGPQMGLLNFYAKTKLISSIEKQFFTFKYINTTKNFYYMTYEGFRLPNILLHDQYGSILYHSNTSKIHRWSAGPSIEFYNSEKPILNSDDKVVYSVKKYRLEYRSFIGSKLMLTLKAGVGDFYYKESEEIKVLRYDFHILSDYNLGGYGIRFAYDYGPMVNTGIYQFAIDASNNSINLSPYAMKHLFKGRLSLSLFANLAYRLDLKYGTININPKIEAYIFKDWYVVAGGTYSYVNQEYKGKNIDASYYYTELSIKKKWGKSDYKKWQKDLRRIKIVFFQDNNGNGVKDNFEQGIPHVKARLLLINSADQKRTANFPVDITLLSNDKGNAIFSRIPMGLYELTITPLIDQKEYFYVSKTAEKIEVTRTDIYYVPFQKASKIQGQIEVSQRKYSLKSEKIRDLANIKVTAFNKQGNSYSAFTRMDGSFVLYAPGNNIYYLRISNVFGKNYRILQNDLKAELPNPNPIVFKVVEKNRQINFKQAKPQQKGVPKLQKIKVLPGKIYKNDKQRLAEQNPLPEFNIKNKPPDEQIIIKGKYYVVLAEATNHTNALKYIKIHRENGVFCHFGIETETNKILIFTNYYSTQEEAKNETKKLKASGMKKALVQFIK